MPINFSSPTNINGTTLLKTRIAEPFVGEIFRLNNSGNFVETYTFTDLYDESQTITIGINQILYNLEKSGSSSDSLKYAQSGLTDLKKIKLLITGSSLGNTFTEELLTTVGSGNWTKPSGVTQVLVECWSGGGSGGGATAASSAGGGGAGGQYSRKLITYTSAQQTISYSIGAGGIGSTGAGVSGSNTTWDTNQVVAVGGAGGNADQTTPDVLGPQAPAAATTQATGDIIVNGTNGKGALNDTVGIAGQPAVYGGGGGGSPGRVNFISLPESSPYEWGVTGGPETGPVISSGVNGTPSILYGGGGGGAAKVSGPNRTGGDGAQGLIRLIYR